MLTTLITFVAITGPNGYPLYEDYTIVIVTHNMQQAAERRSSPRSAN